MGDGGVSQVTGWIGVATQLISLIGYLVAIFGGPAVTIPAVGVGIGAHLIGTSVQAKSRKIGD